MPSRSISLQPQNGSSSIIAINCGSSSPRLGGAVNISSFQNIAEFRCNNNDITAITGYSNNSNLQVLEFFNNKVTGSLSSLSTCTELQEIQCGNNLLSGSLPTISSLVNLTVFHCFTNQFSGSIPAFPSSIASVSLHTNQFTGSIPSLTTCTDLNTFHCFTNQLTGSIPNLSSNINLVDFRCQTNQLTGSIPNLSTCTQLTTFLCDNNQLTNFTGGSVSNTLGYFQAHNNQLPSSAINAILAAFVAANRTSGTRILNLSGAGNVAPTGQGITDKVTLISRGWTVLTN